MTGPRCHEKKHVTATLEYSSPTGSFDEIVLACDLGLLSNEDYAALVEALPP
jgi:hypothetical protein